MVKLFDRLTIPMHPSTLDLDTLLADCDQRRERRSGPGGQHRNKVETAVIITHRPTGIQAEANERRSQADNRREALRRLRLALAIEVRSEASAESGPSVGWLARCRDGRIAISETHRDFPALLAEALDAISRCEFHLPAAANFLHTTASQLLRLLRKHPPALERLNATRESMGLRRLK